MDHLQNTLRRYADKTEVDPLKLTLAAGLCAPLFASAGLIGGYAQTASSLADVITSAVADPARPEGDRNRDVARKPVESLQFSEVKPGDAVADFNAGAGYFTRLLSDVVGSRGHVYAIEPVEIQRYVAKSTAELRGYAANHSNITVSVETALESLHLPRKLDLFWISQNYHDLHNKFFGPVDITAFNKAVFDPATVRREVQAAGFVFDSESLILANPADPCTIKVFDKSIQGHSDQLILKFRKPQ
jgi:predicted methyltransferase